MKLITYLESLFKQEYQILASHHIDYMTGLLFRHYTQFSFYAVKH